LVLLLKTDGMKFLQFCSTVFDTNYVLITYYKEKFYVPSLK